MAVIINGRTPEEIKLWVEYMSTTNVAKKIEIMKKGFPYQFNEDIAADALALIQQLERERDAAVEDIPRVCFLCKHVFDIINGEGNGECMTCSQRNKWQWRGVQEVE